jgi:hypothetical protein
MGLPGWMPGRPAGDPQRLSQMADAWDALDSVLQASERQLAPHAGDISTWWRGQAASAYSTAWHDYSAGLAPLHRQIEAVSGTLHVAAFANWSAQSQYDQVVEEVVAGAVVLTDAAFFTFGLSEAGEGGVLAAASATIGDLLATLAEALAQVAASIAEALAAMGRIAAQLLLPLGGGGIAGGLAYALPSGGSMAITTTAGGTEILVSGQVVAVGLVAIDVLLAKALGGVGQSGGSIMGPNGGSSQGTSPYPPGAPREIDGYTQHGLKQVLGRDGGVGVTDSAMNDAVEDPLKVEVQPGGKFRYIGKTATVVLNSAGRVVTAWARTSSAWRVIP